MASEVTCGLSRHSSASAEALAAAKAAQNEMYSALMAKRTALQQEFQQKLLRYKDILIKEMVRGYMYITR